MTGNKNIMTNIAVANMPYVLYFCCYVLLLSLYIPFSAGFVPAKTSPLQSRHTQYYYNPHIQHLDHSQQHSVRLRAVVTPQSSSPSAPSPSSMDQRFRPMVSVSPRIKRIKDVYQTREIVNDMTACEFALIVDMKSDKAKIDYGMLIAKLDKDSVLLAQRDIDGDKQLNNRLIELKVALQKKLERNDGDMGMSTSSATSSVISAAEQMMDATSISSTNSKENEGGKGGMVTMTEADSNVNTTELNIPALRVSVREDGTVDWEDTIASGTEVAKFGTQLWERLNGKEETSEGLSIMELLKPVPAKMVATPEVARLDGLVNATRLSLVNLSMEKDSLKNTLREAKSQGKEISSCELQQLRLLDFRCKEEEKRLKLISLDRDMELICLCLEEEVESSLDPGDQKLFLAQVGLIERQLSNILSGLPSLEELEKEIYLLNPEENLSISSLIDDDELGLIVNQVNDLKMRLSLDSQKSEVDWGTLGVVYKENVSKLKEGLEFYSEGSKMIATDIQYAWNLLLKAATGYTLKPREVNSIRRIAKDLFTLIPFTIILIIPLSPIGHVLVFSFIQRFFPDFFPSGFTEKRHNLKKLFAEIEGAGTDDIADLLSPGYGYRSDNGHSSSSNGDNSDDDWNIFDVGKLTSKLGQVVSTGLQKQQFDKSVIVDEQSESSEK